MNTLTPHQSKALNIEKSISLTANAGSGKTFVLAQRFLEIIVNSSTPLNQVAAITFTEKAAGELYKRISEELNKLFITTADSELKHRIEKVRKQLVSAKISTIHSFCIDLLKEFPVEATIDANFIPINEQKASELMDLSIESCLNQMLKEPENQQDVKLLIRLLGSKAILIRELSELIQKRKRVLQILDKLYPSDEKEISKKLFELFKSNVKSVFDYQLSEIISHLKTVNNQVLKSTPKNELATEIKSYLKQLEITDDVIQTLLVLKEISQKILTTEGSIRKKSYLGSPNREDVQTSIDIIEIFFTDLDEIESIENHQVIEKELTKYNLALIRIFRNVLSVYEYKKSELGVLDFEDILLKTKSLLENQSVRMSLSGKYKFLLVDEYQDTNEIQYEIFLPLVDDLKKGNLFIVGDEKQSIYRFRDAELQVFSKTKTDIREAEGDEALLTLPDSFRMAPAICFFVNSLFKNLFRESRLFFNEVSASDLVCARSDDFFGRVEILIADGEESNEAELVARKILSLKLEFSERLKKWSDIAILVRKRDAFSELQKAFIKFQIPFNIVGGTGFYQKQSINDIYNYFAFLLNDKDDAALIGILRSPFFMISDVNLLELSDFEGDSYWEKLKSASLNKSSYWKAIQAKLDENKKLAARTGISVLLRKILKESDFIPIISSRLDGDQEISNLNKLISITNDFFNDEFNTLYDFVTYLNNAISTTEDESQAKIEQGNQGVNILTIHQAKGLEYPAVFLFKCTDTTPSNKVKARSFSVDKDFGILTKVPINENYFTNYVSAPVVGVYNLIEGKKETAELKRLLYVAATRAKDFLFITQTDNGKTNKSKSFASLISQGLNQDISGDKLFLTGELAYLKKEKDKFINVLKPVELEIPVIRSVEYQEKIFETKVLSIEEKKIISSELKDSSKGEIISSTRFSTYSACPLKYNLLYNYKLGDLIQQFRKFQTLNNYKHPDEYKQSEFNSYLFDDQTKLTEFSKLKGEIIHYVLRKNVNSESISTLVDEKLKNTSNEKIQESLKTEIKNDLQLFYDSDEFKYVQSFSNFRNEFEAYLKEGDYYLFGILDRLIIDDKMLIIIDYKTDNIRDNDISKSAEKYLPQLQFYAYIISRLFTKKQTIEGRIIFIKHPEKPFIFKYDEATDRKIKADIDSMISSIRNNNYSLNLNACKECIFADERSQCIKSKTQINNLV
ncbi:MAG: UvrD-helicase domain-containing protein [Ignavibacteriaceae bacterium]|nr:UvrD-helicase domain-containing protein [Ignavibacteriaceae bacterium]